MREEKKGEWGLIKLTPSQPGFCALGDGVTPGHSEAWPAWRGGSLGRWPQDSRLPAQLPSLQGRLLASREPGGTPACPVPLLASKASKSLVLCCGCLLFGLSGSCVSASLVVCLLYIQLSLGSVCWAREQAPYQPHLLPLGLRVCLSLHLYISLYQSLEVYLHLGVAAVWLSGCLSGTGASVVGESALGPLSLA